MSEGANGSNPLWGNELQRGAHRLIWWLLAHQERTQPTDEHPQGIPTGVVDKGWREQACSDMGISVVALWKIEKQLKQARVIICPKHARKLVIRGEAFKF